jgi:hypothetical protein
MGRCVVSYQEQLFDPARYSPASVAVLMRLPASNARAFSIASALGSIRGEAGHDRPLRSGKEASGTLITPRRLPAILGVIGINRRQWRYHVADWEARYVAHRCAPGSVFLFVTPNPATCPMCHQEIEYDHMPPAIKRPLSGFASGSNPVPEAAVIPSSSGTNTAAGAAPTLPLSERKSDTPLERFQRGVVGVDRDLAVEVDVDERLEEASNKTAAPRP